MRRPSARLIIVFIVNLLIGYGISWWIMTGILQTEFRLFGFGNLSIVALLIAVILTTLLDSPLKLGAFRWKEAFWPDDMELPDTDELVPAGRRFNWKLVIVFLINVAIGYAASWGIMANILDTELRVYGIINLSVVAFLIAFILTILLDRPLKLKTFDYE